MATIRRRPPSARSWPGAARGHRRVAQREAEVFCLRYFDDLPNQKIAEVLNMQPGAVGVALHKARAKLELLLSDNPSIV